MGYNGGMHLEKAPRKELIAEIKHNIKEQEEYVAQIEDLRQFLYSISTSLFGLHSGIKSGTNNIDYLKEIEKKINNKIKEIEKLNN